MNAVLGHAMCKVEILKVKCTHLPRVDEHSCYPRCYGLWRPLRTELFCQRHCQSYCTTSQTRPRTVLRPNMRTALSPSPCAREDFRR